MYIPKRLTQTISFKTQWMEVGVPTPLGQPALQSVEKEPELKQELGLVLTLLLLTGEHTASDPPLKLRPVTSFLQSA
jgi:hypothetical protein